ncbi:DNA-directed RNA polymerase subunit H [Candidatus Woesearchaeota archaeon]|nr:DNA-directed RNA polymerase subunit H [Candidatus Woesearchaeota archaeon]
MAKRKKKIVIKKHILIPKHVKLSEKEKKELFQKYNISLKELPKIKKDDPAIFSLTVKEGDIIKIIRQSPTAGEVEFYRGVVSE